MLIDLWHHWLLLRALLVLLLAGPLLVFALLFRGRGQPRRSQGKVRRCRETPPSRVRPAGPEGRVQVSQREWRVGAARPDRRAA